MRGRLCSRSKAARRPSVGLRRHSALQFVVVADAVGDRWLEGADELGETRTMPLSSGGWSGHFSLLQVSPHAISGSWSSFSHEDIPIPRLRESHGIELISRAITWKPTALIEAGVFHIEREQLEKLVSRDVLMVVHMLGAERERT